MNETNLCHSLLLSEWLLNRTDIQIPYLRKFQRGRDCIGNLGFSLFMICSYLIPQVLRSCCQEGCWHSGLQWLDSKRFSNYYVNVHIYNFWAFRIMDLGILRFQDVIFLLHSFIFSKISLWFYFFFKKDYVLKSHTFRNFGSIRQNNCRTLKWGSVVCYWRFSTESLFSIGCLFENYWCLKTSK